MRSRTVVPWTMAALTIACGGRTLEPEVSDATTDDATRGDGPSSSADSPGDGSDNVMIGCNGRDSRCLTSVDPGPCGKIGALCGQCDPYMSCMNTVYRCTASGWVRDRGCPVR